MHLEEVIEGIHEPKLRSIGLALIYYNWQKKKKQRDCFWSVKKLSETT